MTVWLQIINVGQRRYAVPQHYNPLRTAHVEAFDVTDTASAAAVRVAIGDDDAVLRMEEILGGEKLARVGALSARRCKLTINLLGAEHSGPEQTGPIAAAVWAGLPAPEMLNRSLAEQVASVARFAGGQTALAELVTGSGAAMSQPRVWSYLQGQRPDVASLSSVAKAANVCFVIGPSTDVGGPRAKAGRAKTKRGRTSRSSRKNT
ncbi:MAG: hypothetical protein ACTHU0_21460 [Kofleriaceae bacterium]